MPSALVSILRYTVSVLEVLARIPTRASCGAQGYRVVACGVKLGRRRRAARAGFSHAHGLMSGLT
jgi:hypothetical protein